jgi:two-component system sensor histidine kinase PhoQ
MSSTARISGYSLQSRLILVFGILLFLFLGITGVVLERAFRSSVEAGAAERLQVQIYLLLSAVDQRDGEFYFLETPQEPRFNQLDSGLYGYISSSSAGELWRSDSARAFSPPDTDFLRENVGVGLSSFGRIDANFVIYFRQSYGILWEDGISEYNFTVLEDAEPYYSEISNFQRDLWSWLGGAALLLLIIQTVLLRWGLSPLSRMARDLKRIETGEKEKLGARYPKELQGVTANLNMLIESERKQQSRYRTTLGDLAHSLKTPLAVLTGIIPQLMAKPDSNADFVAELQAADEQLERMNQIVTYQLQRAVQTNNAGSLSRRVNIAEATNKVIDALQKVYADKHMMVVREFDKAAQFVGDGRDLMEVLGNVLDNAYKYGESEVMIRIGRESGANRTVILQVDDDGKGIPNERLAYVLQRGARSDTLAQGQGIGLAVVADIVKSYEGDIQVNTNNMGGASIRITFPPSKTFG